MTCPRSQVSLSFDFINGQFRKTHWNTAPSPEARVVVHGIDITLYVNLTS